MTITYLKRKVDELIKAFPEGREKEFTKLALNAFITFLEESAHDKRNS